MNTERAYQQASERVWMHTVSPWLAESGPEIVTLESRATTIVCSSGSEYPYSFSALHMYLPSSDGWISRILQSKLAHLRGAQLSQQYLIKLIALPTSYNIQLQKFVHLLMAELVALSRLMLTINESDFNLRALISDYRL